MGKPIHKIVSLCLLSSFQVSLLRELICVVSGFALGIPHPFSNLSYKLRSSMLDIQLYFEVGLCVAIQE